MQTTQLYVELVLIGMECVFGFCILFANILGIEPVYKVVSQLDSIGDAVVSIGLFYIAGLVCDRLADMLFQKTEDRIRRDSGIEVKSILVLAINERQKEYLEFCRSRIRILRATLINAIFIGITLLVYVFMYTDKKITLFAMIVMITILVVAICYKSYLKMLEKYYNKAGVFEKENVETE